MHHFSVFFFLVFCVFLCNKFFKNVTQKMVFRTGILNIDNFVTVTMKRTLPGLSILFHPHLRAIVFDWVCLVQATAALTLIFFFF